MESSRSAGSDLGSEELKRYGRHLVLPEVGVEGQVRLRDASVLLVGAGGLGSPLALYLAAAGVGRIGLVDFDAVDLSNLQRQILYGTSDVGRPKLDAAVARLRDVNPHVAVEPHPARLTAANVMGLVGSYDIVVDGSDNFPTRYLVNDACVLAGKPNVHGSIFRFEGQVSLFWAERGPCYRCLFPDPPDAGAVPGCAEGGVLGVLPGVIGTLQATEVLKWILGRGDTLCGRLLLFDAMEMRFRELRLRKDPGCPVCGQRPSILEPVDQEPTCQRPAATMAGDVDPPRLAEWLGRGDGPVLLDVRTPAEWAICRLTGARLIPVQDLEARLDEVPRDRDVVVYCHRGMRGSTAVGLLRRNGFTRVTNLAGGIDRWAETVDPSVPRY